MSSDFRPKPGNRLVGEVPLDEPVPDGWQRNGGTFPRLVWRVATGEPADHAVEILGYTETCDCGISSFKVPPKRTRRVTGV